MQGSRQQRLDKINGGAAQKDIASVTRVEKNLENSLEIWPRGGHRKGILRVDGLCYQKGTE